MPYREEIAPFAAELTGTGVSGAGVRKKPMFSTHPELTNPENDLLRI
jgi:hypothetical protein